MNAAASVLVGVGAVQLAGPWLDTRQSDAPSPPPRQATVSVLEPVDFVPATLWQPGATVPVDYLIHAALFPYRDSASTTAAMLREFGYRAGLGIASVSGVPVVVDPFTTLDGARLVEQALETRLRFRDARIVETRAP